MALPGPVRRPGGRVGCNVLVAERGVRLVGLRRGLDAGPEAQVPADVAGANPYLWGHRVPDRGPGDRGRVHRKMAMVAPKKAKSDAAYFVTRGEESRHELRPLF